jgi:hypothetical protein
MGQSIGITVIAIALSACTQRAPSTARIYETKDLVTKKIGNSDFPGLLGFENPGPAKATIVCVVGDTGNLSACKLENPKAIGSDAKSAGYKQGFLEIARGTVVDPTGKDGSDARGHRYRMVIRYELKD